MDFGTPILLPAPVNTDQLPDALPPILYSFKDNGHEKKSKFIEVLLPKVENLILNLVAEARSAHPENYIAEGFPAGWLLSEIYERHGMISNAASNVHLVQYALHELRSKNIVYMNPNTFTYWLSMDLNPNPIVLSSEPVFQEE